MSLVSGAPGEGPGGEPRPIVSIRGLSYRYPGGARPALDDVDLDVAPGEMVVLAGASGSGKSTLLRAVSGLVPHFHGGEIAGTVTVAGLDTRAHRPGQLARHVGTLFQDPETQLVMGTVRAELAFPLENRGEPPARLARAVEEVALALAIDHLLERSTAGLSGGELQRVALGATLATRPAVVVLDEPTSQLDPVAGDELIGLLRRLNDDSELTILLSEHRLERCLAAADRVVALDGGRVACDAPPDEFLGWAVCEAPALSTPGGRLLAGVGLRPAPGVRRARAALRAAGLLPESGSQRPLTDDSENVSVRPEQKRSRGRIAAPTRKAPGIAPRAALELRGVWSEIPRGPAILRGVSVELRPGERVALMGRNGAGKSTLLRHAAGLKPPTRGSVRAAGRVALLLQNPTDYLIHDTVAQEGVHPGTLSAVGIDAEAIAARHPRDLSGGEKQRVALAIVLGDLSDREQAPAVVCLDEPTRGMDRAVKDDLARLLRALPAAVIVATHDPEFVAAFADRVLLLGAGSVIADGGCAAVLGSGLYFATETARILGGAGDALVPERGVALIRSTADAPGAVRHEPPASGARAR
jgi:energy-coupling factor transport system ATP-binding protein